MNANDDLIWLQGWYFLQCDGDWEHDKGVHIGTLDNPGWSITINLDYTTLEDQAFQKIKISRSDNDWITCFIKDKHFEGYCGPTNLSEVLSIFRKWAETFKEAP